MSIEDLLRRHLLTVCRDCENVSADFIFWGKLYPPEALGPKCYDCAAKLLPHAMLGEHTLRQSAVIDLRLFRRALEAA